MVTFVQNNPCAQEIMRFLFDLYFKTDRKREAHEVTDILLRHHQNPAFITLMTQAGLLEKKHSGVEYDSACEDEQNCPWVAIARATTGGLYLMAADQPEHQFLLIA